MARNILIIEDDLEIQEFEGDALEIAGYNTFRAESSLQALDILEKNEINLIVLDLRLPNVDGHQILKKVKSNFETEKIPVLVCSASANKIDVVRCAQYGIKDYIVKPFRLKTFVKKIENIFNGAAEPSEPLVSVNPL